MNAFFFQSIQLVEAVSLARERHQKQREPSGKDTAMWLKVFLKNLRDASPGDYSRLFSPLRSSQLRILIQHLPSLYPDELFQSLLAGLQTRKQRTVASGLWGLLGRFCDLREVIEGLSRLQTVSPWPNLSPESLPDLPEPLHSAKVVAQALALRYARDKSTWLEFVKTLSSLSPGTPADRWEDLPLGRHTLRIILLEGTTAYSREDPSQLIAWAKSVLRPADLSVFALGYLTTVSHQNWQDLILAFLVIKLGDPRLSPDNWKNVPPDILNRVIRWINIKKLIEFFLQGSQDSERFEFWQGFVDDMGPYSQGYATRGQGFFEFPGFGVIEFKDIGNAAYIYPTDVYRRYFEKAPAYSNDTLKNRGELLYWKQMEMRIIHIGSWQNKWRLRIRQLIQAGRQGLL